MAYDATDLRTTVDWLNPNSARYPERNPLFSVAVRAITRQQTDSVFLPARLHASWPQALEDLQLDRPEDRFANPYKVHMVERFVNVLDWLADSKSPAARGFRRLGNPYTNGRYVSPIQALKLQFGWRGNPLVVSCLFAEFISHLPDTADPVDYDPEFFSFFDPHSVDYDLSDQLGSNGLFTLSDGSSFKLDSFFVTALSLADQRFRDTGQREPLRSTYLDLLVSRTYDQCCVLHALDVAEIPYPSAVSKWMRAHQEVTSDSWDDTSRFGPLADIYQLDTPDNLATLHALLHDKQRLCSDHMTDRRRYSYRIKNF